MAEPAHTLGHGADAIRGVLDDLYSGIQVHLAGVEAVLQEELAAPEDFTQNLLDHSRLFGGKRIRPAMMLLSARLCGSVQPHHISLGAVVEMLHHATLIHDDVLDESLVRRRVPTLNARWGNEAAVLLGDYAFARAFALCARLNIREANLLLSSTAAEMCLGELDQIGARGKLDLSEPHYLDIIQKKTASLFGTSCWLGAQGNGVDAEGAAALKEYGIQFGMAFQIVDDLLDLVGTEAEMGKPAGSDLQKGEWTLPVITLLRRLSGAERRDLCDLLTGADGAVEKRVRLKQLIHKYEADAATIQCASDYAARARKALEPFRPWGAVDGLAALTEFVVSRRF